MLVCRRWRAIVIQTPVFWTRVEICPPLDDCKVKFSRFMWSLDVQLARSATATLDLRLSLRTLSQVRVTKLLSMMSKYNTFERCESLELESEDRDLSSISPEDGKFAALRALKITGGMKSIIIPLLERTAFDVQHLIIAGEHQQLAKRLPSLPLRVSKLELDQCSYEILSLSSTLPSLQSLHVPRLPARAEASAPNLTHLRVTELDLTALVALSISKQLEYLEIDRFSDNVLTSIRLPCLKRLQFNGTRTLHWGPIFSPLTQIEAPALISLHIGYPTGGMGGVHNLLKDTVSRPTYQLSPLELTLQMALTPETIEDVLVQSPRVRKLYLTFHAVYQPWNDLAYSLTKQTRRDANKSFELCPNLEVLEIELGWLPGNEEERQEWAAYAQRIMDSRRRDDMRAVTIILKNGSTVVAK